jgi:hypothetical protein
LPGWKIDESPEYDPAAPIYQRRDERRLDDYYRGPGHLPAVSAPRFWNFSPPESWGTRGLRAALARIIYG